MGRDFFTVEINERCIKVCEAELHKNLFFVRSLGLERTIPGLFESPNDQIIEQQGEILGSLCDRLKVRHDNVNVIIPDSVSFSQIIEMPLLKEKELLSAIRYQADEFIPMPVEETSLDIEILNEDKENKKALVFIVAAPKVIIETIEKVVSFAKLIPHVLENELSAFSRYTSQYWNIPGEATTILNIGDRSISMYLYDPKQKFIIASRAIKIGLETFVRYIKVNLNIDEDKALEMLEKSSDSNQNNVQIDVVIKPLIVEIGREVQQFILFVQQKFKLKIDKIITYNYDVSISDLNKKLQEMLNISVITLPIDKFLIKNDHIQGFQGRMSSYVGPIFGSFYEDE